jgi:hypothetical protein
MLSELTLQECEGALASAYEVVNGNGYTEGAITLARRLIDASSGCDEDKSFHLHYAAAVHLGALGCGNDALRQVDLAHTFATPVNNSDMDGLTHRLLTVLRETTSVSTVVQYLCDYVPDGCLRLERCAALVLNGDARAQAEVIGLPGECTRAAIYYALRYAAGNPCRPNLGDCSTLAILSLTHYHVGVDEQTWGFTRVVSSDESIAQHVAARLFRLAVLDEHETAVVNEAYGSFLPHIDLLPDSELRSMYGFVLAPTN